MKNAGNVGGNLTALCFDGGKIVVSVPTYRLHSSSSQTFVSSKLNIQIIIIFENETAFIILPVSPLTAITRPTSL